jgi:hypothetical protein
MQEQLPFTKTRGLAEPLRDITNLPTDRLAPAPPHGFLKSAGAISHCTFSTLRGAQPFHFPGTKLGAGGLAGAHRSFFDRPCREDLEPG